MNLVFIGTGKVGSFFAKKFYEKGYKIIGLYNRNLEKAEVLASEIHSKVYRKIENLPPADIYFITVKDTSIQTIALNPFFKDKTTVHCSGAVPLKVLRNSKNYGVFYPLQTFATTPYEIPILLEANNHNTLKILKKLAKSITQKIYFFNSEQRKIVHISAVFANNFGNHLFYIAKEILKNEDLPQEVINPIIKQTSENAVKNDPVQMQTGPAIRNDDETIKRHLKFLKKHNKDFAKVYKILTKSIKKTGKK